MHTEQSRVLAWAQRYLDGYENYMAMNMKEEALDMLLMAKRNQYSLVQEAAKVEWIVVIPSMEVDELILDVIRDVCSKYPVDNSRIYCAGFSYGGWASNRLGNQHPEIFAAVAPCGAAMDNAYIAGDTENIPEMAELQDIDVAFLPVNQPYTMTVDQCVAAARTIAPKVLIPYHFSQTDLSSLPSRLPEIKVLLRDMQ